MSKILALDLGTSYFKAALVDQSGSLCALHKVPAPITHPQEGYCEMAPDRFRQVIAQAITHLGVTSSNALTDVAAVTFSSQSNSFLLLNSEDQPLTPFIIWADERAKSQEDQVPALSRAPDFRRTTGMMQMDWQYAAAKLLWLRRQRPEIWRQARRLCLISDYLTLWLTGRHVTEAGAAGLLGIVDIHKLQWRQRACDQLALPPSWLPAIVRAGTDLGLIVPEVADALGLPKTCRFVVGCLDQYAGAIGAGNVVPGMVSETTGTVLATVRCARGFNADTESATFQGPGFNPGVFYQMLFGCTSANLLEWYRNCLPERLDFDSLCRRAAKIPPGAEGLTLRPDADKGTLEKGFIGWSSRHTIGHAVRSIMETVAFALAEQVNRLCGSERPVEVRSCGGAARSEVWLQIKADVLNVPFVRTACPSPTCLGSAMLAARALQWADLGELARNWVRTMPPKLPNQRNQEFYLACKGATHAQPSQIY